MRPGLLALAAAAALLLALPGVGGAQAPQPAVGHVWTIVLSSTGYADAFGAKAKTKYLARTLRRKGVLATNYHGIAHKSLPNYLAMVSGQAPTALTRADCPRFNCVYDADVPTLAGTLTAAGRSWRAYMEDIPAECALPIERHGDPFKRATAGLQYATRHNPFTYFRAVTDDRDDCRAHVVGLAALRTDLQSIDTTPSWSFISPDLCHAGTADPCPSGKRGGAKGIDAFLKRWTPRILGSPAFRDDGLLVVTFDQDPEDDENEGGRVGAVMISPLIEPNTTFRSLVDHYGYLRSMEDLFGLEHLGPEATTFQAAGAFTRAARR